MPSHIELGELFNLHPSNEVIFMPNYPDESIQIKAVVIDLASYCTIGIKLPSGQLVTAYFKQLRLPNPLKQENSQRPVESK